jgi:hypothetical protein
MRIILPLLLTAVTACAPPAPPVSQPSADPPAAQSAPSTANPNTDALTWADVANDPQAVGHWRANANETLAAFGGDAAAPAFTFGCERGFMQIERTFSRPHDVALGTNTPLRILLPRGTNNYFAAPAIDRSARLWMAVSRDDPRLDDIVASEAGFAVQAAGDTTRIRHDPMLARVLANCRAN